MKKRIIPLLIIAIFMLIGCGSKNTALTSSKEASSISKQNSNSTSKTGVVSAPNSKASDVKNQFKTLKPGTVPQLNQAEKAKINKKLNPVINNIDATLKSLDDANDINFN